ncbi:polysaccharide pyruvyl transferase family protein [Alcanivorax sp. S71-1-4]|uniref:polysaccharide pyruvyl transferase family protein n=1 Tax=Alcanivorax sp. S71-1-4 TaxID=1177159 RepID=UPI001F3A9A51|nr:polysaccharide pyruvyl transferase family protein [Alcanivorax sp. S71-1-4]
MQFGLLDYKLVRGQFNIGDYVQSLAASQYLPRVDHYINREELDCYAGPAAKIIMNGWFMHHPECWPPASHLETLFVSFHMNRPYIKKMMTPQAVEYFKARGPIGCRDYHTAEVLNDFGVDAYYSCCLTTTLSKDNFGSLERKRKILMVDVLHAVPDMADYFGMPYRYIASHVKSGNIIRSMRKSRNQNRILKALNSYEGYEIQWFENAICGVGLSSGQRFEMARQYLSLIAESSLVLTSRIHCALPCLALGVPVVFVKYGQSSSSNTLRFRGIIDHMNVIDLDGDMAKLGYKSQEVDVNDIVFGKDIRNPNTHVKYAEELKNKCEAFVNG